LPLFELFNPSRRSSSAIWALSAATSAMSSSRDSSATDSAFIESLNRSQIPLSRKFCTVVCGKKCSLTWPVTKFLVIVMTLYARPGTARRELRAHFCSARAASSRAAEPRDELPPSHRPSLSAVGSAAYRGDPNKAGHGTGTLRSTQMTQSCRRCAGDCASQHAVQSWMRTRLAPPPGTMKSMTAAVPLSYSRPSAARSKVNTPA
jgi:hypothetical protein